ncbi:MAG: sugar ABC transporter substrate-binding protein [Betaproteobacteria bacterium]
MKTFRIAVFTKNRSNPAYAGARLGADRVAASLGASTRHYVPEKPDDVAQQVALIDQAIADRPHAMVFVPVHESAINDSIRKIQAAGIPIVSLISPVTVGERVSWVCSDDRELAAEITRHVAGKLGRKGRVIILEGIPGSSTSLPRLQGIQSALAEYPGLAVAASVRGDYQRDIACAAVAALLAKELQFDAVIAANDSMALGALDALGAREPLPLVVGVNAVPEAIAAIKSGRMLATVDFDAMKMACIATEAAVRHLRGETIAPRIALPVQVVDRSNCAAWDKPYEARELPSWGAVMEAQR